MNSQNLSASIMGNMGIDYQKKLIELYSIHAYNKSKEFKCWTEDKKAEKFDDLVMSCVDGDATKLTFLQAKHKDKSGQLQHSDFSSNKDYQLHKYFESYVEIENNFHIDDKTNIIENVIIATNNALPKPANGILVLSEPSLKSSHLKLEIVKNQEVLANISTSYAFAKSCESENVENLKEVFRAIELAYILFKKSSKFHVLGHSKDFLLSKILDVNDDLIQFKPEFLDPGFPQTENFRGIFEKVIKLVKSAQNVYSNIWGHVRKLDLNKIKFLTDSLPNFDSDESFIDEKLKRFMSKLLIVIKLELPKIENAINLRILSHVNDISDLNTTCLHLQKELKKLRSDCSIDTGKIKDCFNLIQNRIQVEKGCDEVKNQLKQQKLHFKESHSEKISKFLESKSKALEDRILIYEVDKNQTFWGLLTLYQLNSSIGYLDTRKWNVSGESFLEILTNANEDTCLALIIENSANLDALIECEQKLKKNQKVKLVVICNSAVGKTLIKYKKVEQKEILCEELAEESSQEYLQGQIQFQGCSVPLGDLIDSKHLEKIPLRELVKLSKIEPVPEEPVLYIQRSIYRKDFFDKKLLEDFESGKFKEFLAFNKTDYEFQRKKGSKASIHLFQKITSSSTQGETDANVQYLQWKKSSLSADQLSDYLYTITEDEFLASEDRICLIAGQAGMGKSFFFKNLTCKLKEKFPKHWVQKFNLQAFYNELRLLKNQLDQNEPDAEKIRKFFHTNFLKIESDSLTSNIFKILFKQGQVILLLDGFDEICGDYKDTVIALVRALMKVSLKNRIFLSTRPEWVDELENNLMENVKLASYWFHPFSEEDQIRFLKSLWEKDNTWDHFAKSTLKNINKSVTLKQKSYAGIPLITNLVGELFMERVKEIVDSSAHELKQLMSERYSMVGLLNHTTKKRFEIHLTRDLGMALSNPSSNHHMKNFEDHHKNLAFMLFFPECFEKMGFVEFDQQSKEILIKCGLVRLVNGKFMFYHQTFAEFFVALFLLDYLKNLKILEIIFKVVLVENGYQIVRLFINHSIAKLVSDENRNLIKNYVLDNIQILSVAARESNLETFRVLFDVLTEDVEGFCMIRQTKKLLMSKDENGLSIFFNLFSNCNVPEGILKDLKNKFDKEFVKEIFATSNGKPKMSTLGAAIFGENYAEISSWLIREIGDDSEFKKQIIRAVNQRRNVLHTMIENSNIDNLVPVLRNLKILEDSSNGKFMEKIILHRDREQKNFIQKLLDNLDKSKSKAGNFKTVLEVVKGVNETASCLENLILSRDSNGKSLIFYLLKRFNVTKTTRFIKFLKELPDSPTQKLDKQDLISKFVLEQNSKGKTFIQIITENFEKSDENFKIVLKILEEVHQSSGCIKELIESKDKEEKTLIFYVAGKFGPHKLMKFIEVVNNYYLNSAPFLHHETHENERFLVYYSKPDISN